MKKKRLTIIFLILLVIISISIYCGIKILFNDPLKEKGYTDSDIVLISSNEKYLEYANNNEYDKNFIKLINTKDFKIEYFDSYLKYIKDNNSPVNDTIFLVNNDINYKYSEVLMNFVKAKYFLKTRLERYMNYYNINNSLDINEVIKRVNSDIDNPFYTNITNTDTNYKYQLICNKYYKLSSTYKSNLVVMTNNYSRRSGAYLDNEAYEHFKNLSDDARKEGLYVLNQSAYRSYANQDSIYNSYLKANGQVWTDKWSARPGHSEHQTGFALDVATKTTVNLGDFEFTNEYKWMTENSYKYGFILRYPKNMEYITGYGFEPWHYRYVGIEAATTIHNENITFEEYYTFYVLKK